MSDEKWTYEDRLAAEKYGWMMYATHDGVPNRLWRVVGNHVSDLDTQTLWEEIKSKIDTCPLHRKAYLLLVKRQLRTGRAPYE